MKRFLAILFLLTFFTNQANAAVIPNTFIFKGSGYGHGVGLSQIGAKGQALAGKSASEIVKYYFPGAEVSPIADSQQIRVNLAHQVTKATFSITSDGNFSISNESQPLTTLENLTTLEFTQMGKVIELATRTNKGPAIPRGSSNLWTIQWNNGLPIVTQKVGAATFKVKYGTIQIRAVPVTGLGHRFEVTNSMRLHDEYLYGISEVPSSWPTQALIAQVIVSRTYAVSRVAKIRKDCDCNVFNTKYDQNYSGYTKESELKYGALWMAAVQATFTDAGNGIAITFGGAPITVYFFSSSGGQTQRAVDVWGSDLSYLTSVPDPWSLDPALNPKYAIWERVITQETMAKAFGLPNIVSYAVKGRTATGSVLNVIGYSDTGKSKVLPVGIFKTAIKLPSSWFDLPTSVAIPDSTTPN